MKRKGVPRLTDFPYDPTNCSRIPDATVVSEAASFKIDDWKTVDEDNLDSIKANKHVRNEQRECATTIKQHFGVEL